MTTKKRSSFILLLEHVHTMEELTDEEFGRFIRAYSDYVENGTEPEFADRSMRMMWKTVKAFDEMNCQKYSTTSEARQEAGRKGALKRWNQESGAIANDSKNSNCHNANSKNSLSVSESVSESVSVSESSSKDDSSGVTTTTSLEGDFRTHIGRIGKKAKEELEGYAERMGEDLVREVIYKCSDTGGRSWAYVRKALLEAETQGVKTVEEYRLTHPSGAGLNQRVDRKEPSGNNWLENVSVEQSLKRLKKKGGQNA